MNTVGHMDDVMAGRNNEGLVKRMEYTEEGQAVELIPPIHSDMLFSR